jgi:hypothetical protein
MYNKLTLFSILLVLGILIAVPVSAHTPMLYVEDYGDGTVFLEGGFSDGSSASGTEVLLVADKEFAEDASIDTSIRDNYLEFIFNSKNFKKLRDTYLKRVQEATGNEVEFKEGAKAADFSSLEPSLFKGKLIIFRSELDDFSTLNLPKPDLTEISYLVVLNAGPGHTVIKDGPKLTEEEKAFLE